MTSGKILRALCAVTLGATLALGIACGGDDDDNDNGNVDPFAVGTSTEGTPAAGFTPPADPPTSAPSGIKSDMLVDANSTTDAVEDAATYAVGEQFMAAIVLQVGGIYQGYQFDLTYDDEVITFDDINNLKPAGLETCSPTQEYNGDRVASFCLNQELEETTYNGPVSVLTFTCTAAGETPIHLFAPDEQKEEEDGPIDTLGTKIQSQDEVTGGREHEVTNHDATITCA